MKSRTLVIALAITTILTSCSQSPLAPTETTVARRSGAVGGTGQADPIVITGTTAEPSSESGTAITPDSTGNSVGLGWMGGGH
jgi:hypothetical protein